MTFLDQIVLHLKEQLGDELEQVCILVPSRRAVVFLREAFARHYRKTIWAPRMMAIQDFVREQSGMQFPESLRLVFELYHSYQACLQAAGQGEQVEPFEQFYSWGEMLLRDFDEVDRYCVDAEQLFTNVRDLREIEQAFSLPEESLQAIRRFWESIDPGRQQPTELQQAFLGVWAFMLEVYTHFRAQLAQKRLAYDGLAYRQLAERLESGQLELPYRHIVFAGFNALSRSEERIVDHLLRNKQASIYWDVDQFYLRQTGRADNGLMGLPARFIQHYHEKWKELGSTLVLHDMCAQQKDIFLTGVPLRRGMAQYAGNLLAQKKLPQEALRQHALVLADENLLFPLLYALPPSIQKLNITMGFPLRQTTVYALLMALTRLLRSMRSDEGLAFAHKETLDVLNNPYLKALDPQLSEQLQQEIHEKNLVFVPRDFLAKKELPPLIEHVFNPPTEAAALPQYFEGIFEFLLADAQEREDHLEAEYIFVLFTRFNQLQHILQLYTPRLSVVGFSRLFREVMRASRIPFEGEPLQGLQIMGFLETRLLDFEYVYVLGANEGALPDSNSLISFIPYNLRKGFGLPTHEERDLLYAYHFYRLIQRAREVHLIYSTALQETGAAGEASRFVQQIRYLFPVHTGIRVHQRQVNVPSPYLEPQGIHIRQDEQVHQLLLNKYLARQNGHAYFSATALTTYLTCPLRFYFRYVLGLREPGQIEISMEANTFGSVLHHTLELLYGPYRGKRISPAVVESLKKQLPAAMQQAFREHKLGWGEELVGKNFLLKRVIEQLCTRLLEHDSLSQPFEVLHLEEKAAFAHLIEVDGQHFRINGTFDRVDYLPEQGITRIVDYKTGQVKLDKADIAVADCFADEQYKEAFQGYLYAWLYRQKVPQARIQVGFYTVRKLSEGIRLLNKGELISEERLAEFESHLRQLIGRILSQDFGQVADEKKCSYCPYREICNRG